ncbi:hypothetical protein AAFF_G00136050 [Aldrovandia affinis]|uniref:Uncharacterized protein n=1 Tax=Aldrovandia affinis TaxID=143900 RepID=A0AAD7RQ25_9TELE|nr:hypothetical protein AAFF_G00136050 [Aldrovandia affinis]
MSPVAKGGLSVCDPHSSGASANRTSPEDAPQSCERTWARTTCQVRRSPEQCLFLHSGALDKRAQSSHSAEQPQRRAVTFSGGLEETWAVSFKRSNFGHALQRYVAC